MNVRTQETAMINNQETQKCALSGGNNKGSIGYLLQKK